MDKTAPESCVSAAEDPPVEEGLGTAIPRDSPDSLGAQCKIQVSDMDVSDMSQKEHQTDELRVQNTFLHFEFFAQCCTSFKQAVYIFALRWSLHLRCQMLGWWQR